MRITPSRTTPTLAACALACVLATPPAGADDIFVSTVADTNDGYCTELPIPPWSCSLREAVILANGTVGKDTIHLPAGTYVLSLEGTGEDLAATGDLDILDDVDIKGAGAGLTIIDGNQTDRVFHSPSRAPEVTALQLFDLTVQNGAAQTTGDDISGAGIFVSLGGLYLWRCEVRSNIASAGGGQGIFAQDTTLLIVDSTIADNGPLPLDPNDPHEKHGGGVSLGGGTLLSIRSTFHSNRAHKGSAIQCDNAVLNTANTTFANNIGYSAGALYLVGCDTVIDSTTFSGNTPYAIGGNPASHPGQVTIRNTYINDGCNFGDINFCPTSEGANVSTDVTCCLAHPTDVESHPANQVGPLGDHGGHTRTMLPLWQTILVDNPDANDNCQSEDQRGIARPQEIYAGLNCDVGAVELRPADLSIFTDGFESGDTSAWE